MGTNIKHSLRDICAAHRSVSHNGGDVVVESHCDGSIRAGLFDWTVPYTGAKVQAMHTSTVSLALLHQVTNYMYCDP